ncbi:hypothetical protein ACLOJK_017134 [Asimina triloba]
MALSHLMLSYSVCCFRIGVPEDQKNLVDRIRFGVCHPLSDGGSINLLTSGGILPIRLRTERRAVVGRGRSNVTVSPTVDSGKIRTGVEIPVTCYQIIGVPDIAEKDAIVKSVMDLKSTEIEEGYTLDVVVSRQDLLMDVRDKLLFEPEYAGNVGEEKLVLEIGRAALQHPDSKPYTHDLLLSMALAECSIAKAGFEKNKVSQGFEALARAQYLLRSKSCLGKIPLLVQIEESLEELAPSCALELLSMPTMPENSERRRGALAALRELLRQGLEVESSCRVQDWPCFLSQALSKLMANEIVDLVHWDELAIIRKNKKSLESQNQRAVVDFNCLYTAMIAHIGLGFSCRQTDLINKAKTICECLVASEGIDLKFEESFCSHLLGQGSEAEAAERLRQLETNCTQASRTFEMIVSDKAVKENASSRQLLGWSILVSLFLLPGLLVKSLIDNYWLNANFFRGEKGILSSSKLKKGITPTIRGTCNRSPSFVLPPNHRTFEEPLLNINTTRSLGSAAKRLAPSNLESQLSVGKSGGGNNAPSVQLKRNIGTHQKRIFENWFTISDIAGRITFITILGCVVFTTCKLLFRQFGLVRIPSKWHPGPQMNTTSLAWTLDPSSDLKYGPAYIDRNNVGGRLGKLLAMFKKQIKHPPDVGTIENKWPAYDFSSFAKTVTGSGKVLRKREMPQDEAEALVKQWQAVKADALGPNHWIHILPDVLAESMLAQWQALAESAKSRSCFWRFVLLGVSITRADILSDGTGEEVAEVEAILEEAAELVDDSETKNPTYYRHPEEIKAV